MTSEVQDISEAYIHLIHKKQYYTTDYNIYIYIVSKLVFIQKKIKNS